MLTWTPTFLIESALNAPRDHWRRSGVVACCLSPPTAGSVPLSSPSYFWLPVFCVCWCGGCPKVQMQMRWGKCLSTQPWLGSAPTRVCEGRVGGCSPAAQDRPFCKGPSQHPGYQLPSCEAETAVGHVSCFVLGTCTHALVGTRRAGERQR